jgi:hypothetical protein
VKQDHPLFEETRVAITGMDMMFSNLLNWSELFKGCTYEQKKAFELLLGKLEKTNLYDGSVVKTKDASKSTQSQGASKSTQSQDAGNSTKTTT